MNTFDFQDLDGNLLTTIIAVYEEGSVTKGADRLNVSQSTLSHRLERLRKIFDDPLFIRSGRGIQRTKKLQAKMPAIIAAKSALQLLLAPEDISPSAFSGTFSIATSDFERSVLLFDACRQLQKEAPNLNFRFKWEQFDNTEALRNGQFDLAIAPFVDPLPGTEICRHTLFKDALDCFVDSDFTTAPSSLDEYLRRDHISVMVSETDRSFIDTALHQVGRTRRVKFIVPSISEVPALLKGSELVVTLPRSTKASIMSRFVNCPPPFKLPELKYALFWHAATDTSILHNWVRNRLIGLARAIPKDQAGNIAPMVRQRTRSIRRTV